VTTRREVEKAVWHSKLEPPAKLIVLALAAKSDNDTAVVEPKFTPSLSTLQAMTGLSRSAVAEWLNALEDAGWVKRSRPPAGSRDVRTSYALLVGALSAARRKRKPSSPPGGPANEPDVSEFGSPQDGLVRQEDHPSSPPSGPGVVRLADPSSPPSGPAPLENSPTESSSPKEPSSASKPKRRVTDDDPDFAAFWLAYPRKISKGHARTAWATATKDADPAAIVAAAETFAGQCERFHTEQRFIPHPTTWLRGERWADQPETAARSSPTNGYQAFTNPADEDAYGGTL
jgi:DNA-binding MarR family transcriptional regulator